METIMKMPANYAALNANEMEYTDGGVSVSWKWYGAAISVTSKELSWLRTGLDVLAYADIPAAAKVAVKAASAIYGYLDKGRGVTFHCTITPFPTVAWVSSN